MLTCRSTVSFAMSQPPSQANLPMCLARVTLDDMCKTSTTNEQNCTPPRVRLERPLAILTFSELLLAQTHHTLFACPVLPFFPNGLPKNRQHHHHHHHHNHHRGISCQSFQVALATASRYRSFAGFCPHTSLSESAAFDQLCYHGPRTDKHLSAQNGKARAARSRQRFTSVRSFDLYAPHASNSGQPDKHETAA